MKKHARKANFNMIIQATVLAICFIGSDQNAIDYRSKNHLDPLCDA